MKKILPPQASQLKLVRLFIGALVTLLIVLIAYMVATAHVKMKTPFGSLIFNNTGAGYHITAHKAPGAARVLVNNQTAVPQLSYDTPQILQLGQAVSIAPTTRGVLPFGFADPQSFPTGGRPLSRPLGVVMDTEGNMYISDSSLPSLVRIPKDGGASTLVGSGFLSPSACAIDAAGNIYVADYGNHAIKEIVAHSNGNNIRTINAGLAGPAAIAVDSQGYLYVADIVNNDIKRVSLSDGSYSYIATSVFCGGLAVDANGNLYFENKNTNIIYRRQKGDNTSSAASSGYNNPGGISIDAAGHVYVADYGNNAIKMLGANDGDAPVTIKDGMSGPISLTTDRTGNIYVAELTGQAIKKISPNSGYFLSQPLPAGLSFSSTTGVISGTPIAITPPKNDTIRAYNASGSSSASISLEVRLYPPATIQYAGPQTYTASMAITPLTPTSTNVNAPVYGVPSVYASGNIAGGLAADRFGNLFVGDASQAGLKKFDVNGGAPSDDYTGLLGNPTKIAMQADGFNFSAYNADAKNVIRNTGINTVAVIASNVTVTGLAIDSQGNTYYAEATSGTVNKVPAGTSTSITLASNITKPGGLAVDAAGNLYVGDYNTSSIIKIPGTGGNPVTIATNVAGPAGLAVDNAGNIYEADDVALTVRKITQMGVMTQLGSGWGMPKDIAIDGMGNVYVVDKTANAIKKVLPIGGYFISPALPKGLNFDTATGTISGIPAGVNDASYYLVTGWNSGGSTLTTVNIKSVLPPLPVISYSKSQTFAVGKPASLAPVSSNVGVQGYAAPTTVNAGYGFPWGVTVDGKGNIYVATATATGTSVVETPADGSAPVPLPFGVGGATGVAVDAIGNIYAAAAGIGNVRMLPANGNPAVTLASGFQAWDVAIDNTGNVFVTDGTSGKILKQASGTTGFSDFILGTQHPHGISTDAAGSIYVSDPLANVVNKYNANGVFAGTLAASGLNMPVDVKVDAQNNFYVVDQGNHAIKKYASSVDVNNNVIFVPLVIGSGFTQPQGIAIDNTGKVYVTEATDNSLKVIVPSGGYFVSPALPPGLYMDQNTGIISGTPTTTTPVTKYTITGYNAAGSSTTAITIRTTTTPVSIAYNTPQVLPLGTAANQPAARSGVDAFGYSQAPGIISGPEVTKPSGIITDAAGNVFVVDAYTPYVIEYPADGSKPVHIGSGLMTPVDVATDNKGFLYVIDRGGENPAPKKINISTGAVTVLPGIFYNPNGIAVDIAGNVYVTDLRSQLITKIPVTGTPVAIGSGWVGPYGIKFDPYGNMYVSEYGKPSIKMVPAGSTTPVLIGSGLSLATGLTVDASGNVFVCDYSKSKLFMFPADNSAPVVIASGIVGPNGVAVDPKGQLYLADYTNGVVKVIKPAGGMFLDKFLPKGLTFNNSTGTIAGTPVAATPPTDYFVTAYNATDSASAKVNIRTGAVSSIATLSNLATSTGTLSPVFASGTTAYNLSVSNATTSIKITPTATDADATIKVKGTTVASGVASGNLALAVGSNTITTVVTAGDGTTTKTYTVTVTRSAGGSTDALLSSLKISPVTPLTSVSGPGYQNYTTAVPNSESSIKVIPTGHDATSTIRVNGTVVASGVSSASIPLTVGSNVITTVVTAQDGATMKSYIITVTRAAGGSADALLSSLKISPVTPLTTVSGPGYQNYTTAVPNSESSIKVIPTGHDATSTIRVNGAVVASGVSSASIPLAVGSNVITTVVTAQDGTTTKSYIITVTRAAAAQSDNAVLSAIKITPATGLTLVSGGDYKDYTTTVPAGQTSVTITPTAQDANATIKVNGVTVASGTASAAIPLTVGTTVIKTVVTAQDGVTVKTYSITFTRPGSNNAVLTAYKLTPATPLTTVTGSNYRDYTTTAPNSETTVKITPTAQDANATIKVNGVTVASGTASTAIPLNVGDNVINTVVTAQDGVTKNTYSVKITRAPASMEEAYQAPDTLKTANDGITVHPGLSPNGDGISDVLQIDGIRNYPDNTFQVISRSGVLVYSVKGYDNESKVFDGHSNINGKLQQPGTYFYRLEYTADGKAKFKTGFIVIKY